VTIAQIFLRKTLVNFLAMPITVSKKSTLIQLLAGVPITPATAIGTPDMPIRYSVIGI